MTTLADARDAALGGQHDLAHRLTTEALLAAKEPSASLVESALDVVLALHASQAPTIASALFEDVRMQTRDFADTPELRWQIAACRELDALTTIPPDARAAAARAALAEGDGRVLAAESLLPYEPAVAEQAPTLHAMIAWAPEPAAPSTWGRGRAFRYVGTTVMLLASVFIGHRQLRSDEPSDVEQRYLEIEREGKSICDEEPDPQFCGKMRTMFRFVRSRTGCQWLKGDLAEVVEAAQRKPAHVHDYLRRLALFVEDVCGKDVR